MSRQILPHSRRMSVVLIVSVAAVMLVIGSMTRPVSGADAAMKDSPAQKLATLKFKFNGANSCKGSGCHNEPGKNGKAAELAPPPEGLHEWNIWSKSDKHAKSYSNLANADSKDIAKKLS